MSYDIFVWCVSVFCAAWFITGNTKDKFDAFVYITWSVAIHTLIYKELFDEHLLQ